MHENDIVTVGLYLYPTSSKFLNKGKNIVGGFQVGMKKDGYKKFEILEDGVGPHRKSLESYVYQYPTMSTINTHWGKYYRMTYNDKTIGDSFDEYYVGVRYTVSSTNYDYSRYLYVQDFTFEDLTQSEYEKKQLNDVIEPNIDKVIGNQNSNTDKITQNQNSNTDKITSNQDKNTQDIIDNQNQLQENEKNEIQDSGNQATESVDDIPNQSDGFINAMGGLVSAMSYNGTECKWTLPKVEMPKVANIVPKMTLIKEQEIDFGFWVQKMPSNILSLVQAVCTCALIVFCFKELYGTISYVFTLKGGGE